MDAAYFLLSFLTIFWTSLAVSDVKRYCGLSPQKTSFIINGSQSRKNQWPWMVSIYLRDSLFKSKLHYKCAGVLIHRNMVITAAHCTYSQDEKVSPKDLVIVTGEHSLSKKDKGQKKIRVRGIYRHPKYRTGKEAVRYDIAVLELRGFNKNSAVARPVCLPKKSQDPFDKKWGCMALGWGQTKPGDVQNAQLCETVFPFKCKPLVVIVEQLDSLRSDTLQQVSIPIWNKITCESIWEGKIDARGEQISIGSSMFCGGKIYTDRKSDGKGPCSGDSGGPIVCSKDSNTWYVLGLVSWGRKPCMLGFPGVYSNVAYLSDFVINIVKANGCADVFYTFHKYASHHTMRWFFAKQVRNSIWIPTVANMGIWGIYYTQVLGVLLMSANRFVAVVFPMKYPTVFSQKNVTIFICIQWLLPAPVALVMLHPKFRSIYQSDELEEQIADDFIRLLHWKAEIVFECICLLLLVVFYSGMIWKVKKINNTVQPHNDNSNQGIQAEFRLAIIGFVVTALAIVMFVPSIFWALGSQHTALNYVYYFANDLFTGANPYLLLSFSTLVKGCAKTEARKMKCWGNGDQVVAITLQPLNK